MGACISSDAVVIHQLSQPNQMAYPAKPSSFVISSPIGNKPSSMITRPMPEEIAANYRLSSSKFRSFGSKEDIFFESQPWLESDGDDEFFSVNGDMTPSITSSASNTPVHSNLSASLEDTEYKLTPSPVKTRKSLSELFKESEDEDRENSNQDTADSKKETGEDAMELNIIAQAPKSVSSKRCYPALNITNSSNHVKVQKDGSCKSAQGCLPRLFAVSSSNNTKKCTTAAT